MKTIKNDDTIYINRTIIDPKTEVSTKKQVAVGRYYFEASREMKQVTIQLYLDEAITSVEDKLQVHDIFKEEYIQFISDTQEYGWGSILDVAK